MHQCEAAHILDPTNANTAAKKHLHLRSSQSNAEGVTLHPMLLPYRHMPAMHSDCVPECSTVEKRRRQVKKTRQRRSLRTVASSLACLKRWPPALRPLPPSPPRSPHTTSRSAPPLLAPLLPPPSPSPPPHAPRFPFILSVCLHPLCPSRLSDCRSVWPFV